MRGKKDVEKIDKGIFSRLGSFIKRAISPKTSEAADTAPSPNVGRSSVGTQPSVITSANDKVMVINPEGKKGKIPRSQLAAALKQGYKQVQE